jgi:hypothetical protein
MTTLEKDGIDLNYLCTCLSGLKNFPNQKPSTILGDFSSADQRRIKALPKNLRAIAALLSKDGFSSLLTWGALRVPGLVETLNHLQIHEEGMIPMRNGRRGDLLSKLPEVLEDVAEGIEKTIQRPPHIVTFAFRMTGILNRVEAQSRSKREHYREILDILDPEQRSPMTYDGLRNLVARERARWKSRSRQLTKSARASRRS